MQNDKIKSQIMLPVYLIGNGFVTGQFIQQMRVIATRNYDFNEMAPMFVMTIIAMYISGTRALHHYNNLYNNKQK